jgi:sugar lactone lactonase YvrE
MPSPCPGGSICTAGAVAPVSCSVSLLTSVAVSSVCDQPVYVSTFAGGAQGTQVGFTDGVGTNASMNWPTGMAFDGMGNMYVGDYQNHRIRMITPAGIVTTVAGSGTAAFADGSGVAAMLNLPQGVCTDESTGIVFFADVANCRIRQLQNGVVSTLAGSGAAAWADGVGVAASFNIPRGVACDSSGIVYIGDTNNHRVRRIVVSTRQVTTIGGGTTSGFTNGVGTLALFNGPEGVRWIPSTNVLLVADISNNAIRQISASGAVSTVAGTGAAGAMDGAALAATFNVPCDVIMDASGNLYVNDNHAGTIRKISVSGRVTTVAGLSGGWGQPFADGSGASVRFSTPNRLALDRRGILYVADHYANRIRAVRVNGAGSTCAAGQYGSLVADTVSQSASCSPCTAGSFCPEGMFVMATVSQWCW